MYIGHREAPNALCKLVEREKKSFQVTTKNCLQNASDLEGSLVMSSRLPYKWQ